MGEEVTRDILAGRKETYAQYRARIRREFICGERGQQAAIALQEARGAARGMIAAYYLTVKSPFA